MGKSALLCIVGLLTSMTLAFSADQVKVWEEPLTLPTYMVKPAEKSPIFFRNQSYQGASRVIYPYALQDNITDEKTDVTYKALYLENEYIKLCVLPEIGGRLFYATDKTNGYEIFYRQHVIKPANVGMLGAWISGGIEFCVFHHHRASTNLPVDYKLEQNSDGSATIWIGETEPRHRMKWTLGISLYPGKSYIEINGRLMNPTDDINSMLYWANVATHVNDDYQIIFPPSTDFAVYHAKNSFTHWPITTGTYNQKDYYQNHIDASWWKNHPTPISMFAHEITEGFLAGYDYGQQAGTMHVANHNIVKGAKLWEWGPGAYGAMWDSNVLTDSDGPYAELMTGAYSDNQPDYSWLKPDEYKTFQQFWYPLRETQGAVAANLTAAINLKKLDNDQYLVAANTTQPVTNVTLILRKSDEILYQTTADISPDNPISETLTLPNVRETDMQLALVCENGEEIISYQPVAKDTDIPLPETVTPPAAPSEIKSLEELYLTGLRIYQFHNARLDPTPYFQEALQRDPLDIRSNTMMGILAKQNFELQKAAHYFRTALKRLTANYTRPRDCEPFFHLGVVLLQQGNYSAAYDTLYRAAWDQNYASPAYFHLAQISTRRNDLNRAMDEINRSLAYNSSNINAMNLKTSLLRVMDKTDQAKELITSVLGKDALNAYALNESVLLGDAEIAGLVSLLRDNPESYLELAVSYVNAGLTKEAMEIVQNAAGSSNPGLKTYPTIHYYLGYLHSLQNNANKAKTCFKYAGELPIDYCFPYRFETIAVLKNALATNPDDDKAYYYLGNLLYDKQPEQAISYWEKAISINPDMAMAHRNLGWGYHQTNNDLEKAIAAYETAIKKDPTQSIYYIELDKLYEKNGTDIQKRYRLLVNNHETVAQRTDALLQEIKVLMLAGEYQTAIDYFQQYFFPRQEGIDNLHDYWVDACLGQGIAELDANNHDKALEYFKLAEEYPENHQMVAEEHYEKNAQIRYYQALALGKSDQNSANELQQMITDMQLKTPIYQYYQALVLKKSGDTKKAKAIADMIKKMGDELLSGSEQVDFFSKFGEGQSIKARQAEGHFLLGLAASIQDDPKELQSQLKKSLELDPGALWARIILKNS